MQRPLRVRLGHRRVELQVLVGHLAEPARSARLERFERAGRTAASREARARALKEAGLDHIQLSFQDSTRELNDFISSTRTFELKNKVAGIIKSLGYPMVLNCVMHRFNLPHVGRIIEMAERMGADYLELANTQYYGWAWLNREALMPTRDELRDAEAMVMAYRERGASRMKVLWVSPDYADAKPKPCMAGWGAVFLVVAPDGVALPCHSARMLPAFAAAVLVYLPALGNGFVWNDPDYVTRGELQSLPGLWRIWTEVGATEQYYPLLHTFFWLQHRLWGDAPFGYHLVNVLLHAGCAVLLVLVVRPGGLFNRIGEA